MTYRSESETGRSRSTTGRLRLAAAAALLMALAACTTPFKADVSRFQSQLPAPAGQTFAIVADDPKLSGGLEFSHYASIVRDRMAKVGYVPVQDAASANLIVRFEYGVDGGRERVRSTPMAGSYWGPWGGYGGFGGWGGGFYGRSRFGYGGWGGPWRYGFYDPFFDGGVQSYTIFTSGVSLKIDRTADGQRLFEGKAEAVSSSNRLQYLVPNLVEAMFTNFPGNSGETVRITVAPEKK